MAAPSNQQSPDARAPKSQEQVPSFTVFVRLPFPRGDFVDPPPVQWSFAKDTALWDIISKASNGKDLDWHALAEDFNVTLSFLLQQAAWLYERHLSQVRAQLRKVNRPVSIGTPPMPSSVSGSGFTMTRGGSHGSRVPSSLAHRNRETGIMRDDVVSPDPPTQIKGPRMSRTSSTNTVYQIQKSSPIANQIAEVNPTAIEQGGNASHDSHRKPVDTSPRQQRQSFDRPRTPSAKARESSSSSSESESEAEAPMSRSRLYTRRPRFSASKAPLNALSDADEDSEDSPPFLPFSDPKVPNKPTPQAQDPSATLRIPPKEQASQKPETKSKQTLKPTRTVNSSSSSAQSQPARSPQVPLSSLSPRQRRLAKEGSEGTPSMGSSFSDLDDASVTQSALEEALANEMTHGGVASRMSTISQALRSRYL
ncbi:hypothetical protein G7Y79_00004g012970 [Physcia stellaris]|nr:hypothetical protein G7Y79_00004g012970 [Physcia stellaris]